MPMLLALPRLLDETYVVGYCFGSHLGDVLVLEFSFDLFSA
jgi:hypothetical protein